MSRSDVVVIGAGPVGLYTAYYCGLRKLNTIICDSLDSIGGQLSNQYPEKVIYDLPGFETVTAGEFIKKLDAQLQTIQPHVERRLNFKVDRIVKNDDYFEVWSGTAVIEAKAVIIAIGNGSFEPRKMGLSNEDSFNNIHYYVSKLSDFEGKNVGVFGGGDSAIDWSLMLEPIAQSVSLIHRRDEFRAKEAIVERLHNSKVKVKTPFIPVELTGENDQCTTVLLSHVEDKSVEALELDALIVSYGTLSTNLSIQDFGVALEGKKVIVDQRARTNVPGIFACGDISYYEGREVQIVQGMAEGMMASSSASQYINNASKSRPIR